MRLNYIMKIESQLKRYRTISTNRLTSRILDGSYVSMYKGRSMNFDELREYEQGDDIRDIDFKASARNPQGKFLVKQYIAEKKHNIMLCIDTNKRMLADTPSGYEKRETAIMTAGTLACLVSKNGDYVSATFSNDKLMEHYPFKSGTINIENILEQYYKAVNMNNESTLTDSLKYIIRNYRRRMIILIVTDIEGIRSIDENVLRQIRAVNDVLLVCVEDAQATGGNVYSVKNASYLPEFLTGDKKLAKILQQKKQDVYEECEAKLKRYGIAHSVINSCEEIDTKIIELLEKHKKS